MPCSYEVDRDEVELRYKPHVARFIAKYFDVRADSIRTAPADQDLHYNTDLISDCGVRFATRVRRPDVYSKRDWKNEFTIRTQREHCSTELEKLLNGWGDYIVYCHGHRSGEGLRAALIGNLDVFRQWYRREVRLGRDPGEEQRNPDGSSLFRAFSIRQLPRYFIHTWKDRRFIDNASDESEYEAAMAYAAPARPKAHTAYRFGLCIDCRIHPYSAGRPRCYACHSKYASALVQYA